jgi:hypothetical protein
MKIRVKYSLGKTINLGNYQSARIDVGVEIEDDIREGGLVESLFQTAKGMVKAKLEESIKNKDWD